MPSDSEESQSDNDSSFGQSAVKRPSRSTAKKPLGRKRKHDSEDEDGNRYEKTQYLSEWLMRRPLFKAPDSYAVNARRQVVHLMKDGKYKDAWILLLAIVETDRISVHLLWEIGLLLTKKLDLENPADYLQRAHVSCAGPKAIPIFVEWMQELMRQGRYDEARTHIETAIEGKGYKDHPDVLRLSALLYTRSPPKDLDDVQISAIEQVLLKAYHARPQDPDVIDALLMFLKDTKPDQASEMARNVLELGGSRHDARMMKIALKYYRPPVEPFNAWLKLMLPLHLADPSTDPDIYGKLYYGKMIHTRQTTRDRGMRTYTLRCILSFVFDRIEVGCHDEWTLDVLESTIQKISSQFSTTLIRMLEERKVLQKILEIQPKDPSIRSRLLSLHTLIIHCWEKFNTSFEHKRQLLAKPRHTQ